MARLWLPRLRTLNTGSGLSRACPMYLAEPPPLPPLQDSLNQMLEIPEFSAVEQMKVKRNVYFHFLKTSLLPHSSVIILVLWVVIFQGSDVRGK